MMRTIHWTWPLLALLLLPTPLLAQSYPCRPWTGPVHYPLVVPPGVCAPTWEQMHPGVDPSRVRVTPMDPGAALDGSNRISTAQAIADNAVRVAVPPPRYVRRHGHWQAVRCCAAPGATTMYVTRHALPDGWDTARDLAHFQAAHARWQRVDNATPLGLWLLAALLALTTGGLWWKVLADGRTIDKLRALAFGRPAAGPTPAGASGGEAGPRRTV